MVVLFMQASGWPLSFIMKSCSMLRNRMLADPSFLFKVGTEVCYDTSLWLFFWNTLARCMLVLGLLSHGNKFVYVWTLVYKWSLLQQFGPLQARNHPFCNLQRLFTWLGTRWLESMRLYNQLFMLCQTKPLLHMVERRVWAEFYQLWCARE